MRWLATLICCLVLAPRPASAGHVRVSALANRTAISPGKTVTIAVVFDIDPGWHIYWTNPGDSGVATKITTRLSDGLTASAVRFPTPKKIVLPGDIVNYGYTDRAVLLFDVTAKSAGPATVKIDAKWLVCQETCVAGGQSMEVALPAGEGAPAESENFAAWTALLPATADPDRIESIRLTNQSPEKDLVRQRLVVRWKKTPPVAVSLVRAVDDTGTKVEQEQQPAADRTVFTITGPPRGDGQPIGLLFYKPPGGPERVVALWVDRPDPGQTENRR